MTARQTYRAALIEARADLAETGSAEAATFYVHGRVIKTDSQLPADIRLDRNRKAFAVNCGIHYRKVGRIDWAKNHWGLY